MVSPSPSSSLPALSWGSLYQPTFLQLSGLISTEAQQDFNIQPLRKQTPLQTGFRFLGVRWPGPVPGGTVQWIWNLLEQL